MRRRVSDVVYEGRRRRKLMHERERSIVYEGEKQIVSV